MKNRWILIYEILMSALAIISVSMIWIDSDSLYFLDRLVWFIFLIDISLRFTRSEYKWGYIKKHPLDLIAIIPFDAIFQLARTLD
jgi:voltage-gated potassium channel